MPVRGEAWKHDDGMAVATGTAETSINRMRSYSQAAAQRLQAHKGQGRGGRARTGSGLAVIAISMLRRSKCAAAAGTARSVAAGAAKRRSQVAAAQASQQVMDFLDQRVDERCQASSEAQD